MNPVRAEVDAKAAVANGLSIVCATCKKWQLAMERGAEKCLAVDGCGSPIVGDTFHEYDGPITDFLRFCFVCGCPATKGVRVHGHVRLIGACEKHVQYVVQLAPKNAGSRRLPVLPTNFISAEGEVPSDKPLVKPYKSLAEAMMEMDKGTFKGDR